MENSEFQETPYVFLQGVTSDDGTLQLDYADFLIDEIVAGSFFLRRCASTTRLDRERTLIAPPPFARPAGLRCVASGLDRLTSSRRCASDSSQALETREFHFVVEISENCMQSIKDQFPADIYEIFVRTVGHRLGRAIESFVIVGTNGFPQNGFNGIVEQVHSEMIVNAVRVRDMHDLIQSMTMPNMLRIAGGARLCLCTHGKEVSFNDTGGMITYRNNTIPHSLGPYSDETVALLTPVSNIVVGIHRRVKIKTRHREHDRATVVDVMLLFDARLAVSEAAVLATNVRMWI